MQSSYSPNYSASSYARPNYAGIQYAQPQIERTLYPQPTYSRPVYSAPVTAPAVRDAAVDVSRHAVSSAVGEALLKVQVPDNAIVFLDDHQTKSTGAVRNYVWENLQPGQSVQCQIRAEMMVDGKKVQETERIDLRAGAESSLVFDFKKVETTLTLRVPATADVYLGERLKKGSGTVRTFKSTKLAAGQSVSGYSVRVSAIRGGQSNTQEQSISLTGGEAKTLEFRFDRESPVASRDLSHQRAIPQS